MNVTWLGTKNNIKIYLQEDYNLGRTGDTCKYNVLQCSCYKHKIWNINELEFQLRHNDLSQDFLSLSLLVYKNGIIKFTSQGHSKSQVSVKCYQGAWQRENPPEVVTI